MIFEIEEAEHGDRAPWLQPRHGVSPGTGGATVQRRGQLTVGRLGAGGGRVAKRTQFCASRRGKVFLESQKRSQLPHSTAGMSESAILRCLRLWILLMDKMLGGRMGQFVTGPGIQASCASRRALAEGL